jgi:hypothetical protein
MNDTKEQGHDWPCGQLRGGGSHSVPTVVGASSRRERLVQSTAWLYLQCSMQQHEHENVWCELSCKEKGSMRRLGLLLLPVKEAPQWST